MNRVVHAASPAGEEHLTSGFLEIEIGSALRTMDIGFCHL
jgi:hypothetical protein